MSCLKKMEPIGIKIRYKKRIVKIEYFSFIINIKYNC